MSAGHGEPPLGGGTPANGSLEVAGYGASVKAQGRGALIILGFLIMAGAIIYDGWLNRALLVEVMATQKAFIQGYTDKASDDHIELKALCLKERFLGR